jgi:hypothetical protein
MQLQAPWLKPAVWGAIIGSIVTMIVGFSWMGWVLGPTAEKMAVDRANTAVVVALTPSCVSRFMQQPNAGARLKELQAVDSWKQRDFVEAGGWATPSGEKTPNSGVANACAELLLKGKA